MHVHFAPTYSNWIWWNERNISYTRFLPNTIKLPVLLEDQNSKYLVKQRGKNQEMLNFLRFLSVTSLLSQCSGVSNWTISLVTGGKKKEKSPPMLYSKFKIKLKSGVCFVLVWFGFEVFSYICWFLVWVCVVSSSCLFSSLFSGFNVNPLYGEKGKQCFWFCSIVFCSAEKYFCSI